VQGHSFTSFAPGVWLDVAPVRIVGMRLTATMAVIDLGAGNLLVYSPLELTAERRAGVESLGAVAHLYAPNTFHHLWIGAWAAAFPAAKLHAPVGLGNKRGDLRIDRTHGSAPEPAFMGVIDEHRIEGFRLEETVLVHRPTGTLVVADLVHNIGRPTGAWTRIYTRMMGFYDRVALSRVIRWTAFSDRIAARRSLDELLAQPFDRMVVGHGDPIDGGARDALAAAYAWLR
jgi:hypothetical protein